MMMAALCNNVDDYQFQRNLLHLVGHKGFHRIADNHVRDYTEKQNRKHGSFKNKNHMVYEKPVNNWKRF
jgi:hypothetical protein